MGEEAKLHLLSATPGWEDTTLYGGFLCDLTVGLRIGCLVFLILRGMWRFPHGVIERVMEIMPVKQQGQCLANIGTPKKLTE